VAGIEIEAKAEQPENAFDSIRDSFDPKANSNVKSDVQSEKHSRQRTSTEAGTTIDCTDEQQENEAASIRVRFESDPKVKEISKQHPLKHS
jgi:hypothetical protein